MFFTHKEAVSAAQCGNESVVVIKQKGLLLICSLYSPNNNVLRQKMQCVTNVVSIELDFYHYLMQEHKSQKLEFSVRSLQFIIWPLEADYTLVQTPN